MLCIVALQKTQNGSDWQVLANLQILELSFKEKRFDKLTHIARPGYKDFIVRNTEEKTTKAPYSLTIHVVGIKQAD